MKYAWLAAGALILLMSGAGAEAAWYCEPLHAFYPAVGECPVPWRSVDPQFGAQRLATPPTANEATDALNRDMPQPQAPQTQMRQTQAPQTQTGAVSSDQPTFPAPASFMRGDVLDQWCKGSTTAALAAVCGDDDLRELAVQRLYAFEEAKARLNADQQKTLIGDQNGWAMSYPQACGLRTDVDPTLPLAAPLKDCLAKAGRERLQYLKDYGQPKTETAATNPTPTPTPAPTPVPSPQTASPSSSVGPAGTQPPAAAATIQPPPASPQNDTAKAEPSKPNPPAQPTPSNSGSAAASPRHSSLSAVTNVTRTGAMLITILVVAIWAFAAWLRSRRSARISEPREPRA